MIASASYQLRPPLARALRVADASAAAVSGPEDGCARRPAHAVHNDDHERRAGTRVWALESEQRQLPHSEAEDQACFVHMMSRAMMS